MDRPPVRQIDDLFVIYPAHLEWLKAEHNLSVPELCAALGLPSLQAWYEIKKDPHLPVRRERVVQSARIYLKHPERMPVSHPPMRQFVQRAQQLVDDPEQVKNLLGAVLGKAWGTIEEWMKADTRLIDLSARRLMELMMEMEDEEFLEALHDLALSTYVQVTAHPVHVFESTSSKKRYYASHHEQENLLPVEGMLKNAPVPGRRLKDSDFADPTPENASPDFRSVIAQSQQESLGVEPTHQETSLDDEEALYEESLAATAWGRGSGQ